MSSLALQVDQQSFHLKPITSRVYGKKIHIVLYITNSQPPIYYNYNIRNDKEGITI